MFTLLQVPRKLKLTAVTYTEDLEYTPADPMLTALVCINPYASCLVDLMNHILFSIPYDSYNMSSLSSVGFLDTEGRDPMKIFRISAYCWVMGLWIHTQWLLDETSMMIFNNTTLKF